jgi:electron transport complex protein RnfD
MKFAYKPSPNYRTKQTTSGIMRDLTIALLCVYAYSVIYYGLNYGSGFAIRAVLMLADSVAAAMLTEGLYFKATKQDVKKSLLSSYSWITAIILTMSISLEVSYYGLFIATVICIFFGKCVFGGFGQNIFNPAAFGRTIIMASFSGTLATDFATGATPTTSMNSFGWVMSQETFSQFITRYGSLGKLFVFYNPGTIGATSSMAILIAGIILVLRKDMDWRAPAAYIATVFVTTGIIGAMHGMGAWYPLFHLLTGGTMFGAIFMISDPVTSPITIPGRYVFGLGAAFLTVIIRIKSNLPDGVVYSILLMNMLTPAIDKMFDSQQITSYKKNFRNVGIITLCGLAITLFTGTQIQAKTPSTDSSTEATKSTAGGYTAGAALGLSDDYSENKVECTESSNDGKTAVYACTARGFGLIDPDGVASETGHEYKRNEAEITVDLSTMSITGYKLTTFGDTEGVGDAAVSDAALAQYAGKTISDSVDSVSGATYTSKSIAAMAAAALNAAAGK